jgi:hypothetical protein
MRHGARTDLKHSANLQEVSQSQAATMLNVSERLVADAVKVLRQAAPEVVRAVDAGLLVVAFEKVATCVCNSIAC